MTGLEETAVILDATVLSNFSISESISWMTETLTAPQTVPAVRDELIRGIDHGYDSLQPAVDAILSSDIELVETAPTTLQQNIRRSVRV
ncbi:hypothetical protein [Haloarchaeobius amylolyticus]|uniref:hypothetical protein n=1 Tax=Haloarchaeobius amylolyticus TaxID=1198296 RepID=UPI00226F8E6B|nr:hypothetical protein [Haloarchaeobius amylolyticus]